MLSENDKQYLIRNLERNRIVLVTGAGFSHDAYNSSGERLPDSAQLAQLLWAYLYSDPYDGRTPLKTVYEAALNRGRKPLKNFLHSKLHVASFADWYRLVPRWFWRRIYTFNIDDLVEQLYAGDSKAPKLRTIVAPSDFEERDQFLRQIQYIKLHGCVEANTELTFGPSEYATRAATGADLWYLHFVGNYSTLPTLFVGTSLDEQLFWQYLEIRGAQLPRTTKVRRPKCFLVSPTISRPMEDSLERYNIVPIRETGEAFFKWLSEVAEVQTRERVLRTSMEWLDPAISASETGEPSPIVMQLEHFYSVFRVPVRPDSPSTNSLFLLGVPPTWDDIAADVDAPREFLSPLLENLVDAIRSDSTDIVLVRSSAGAGKSTTLKRIALELVDNGHTVYFSDGSSRPNPDAISDCLRSMERKCVLIFDNAGLDLTLIGELARSVATIRHKPLIVVASRTNDWAFRGHELERGGIRVLDVPIPDLTETDIVAVLETLDRHDFLGVLKGKPKQDQIELFKTKAKKQILVAMREATSGRGFDEILKDEFKQLHSDSARLLYVIASIASDLNYGLSAAQFVRAMKLPPIETMGLLEKDLSGVLSTAGSVDGRYLTRHPAIAAFVIEQADKELLTNALTALLTAVVLDVPQGRERRYSRTFQIYRQLLNHDRLRRMFHDETEWPRIYYEAAKPYCRDDGHFWLQYASFEIEDGGDTSLAENYLAQAEAKLPGNMQVQTARAHLCFKQAISANDAATAESKSTEALSILRAHMADSHHVSHHALHIFGSHFYSYIVRWLPPSRQAEALRSAREELQRAIPPHLASANTLQELLAKLKRAELSLVVKK